VIVLKECLDVSILAVHSTSMHTQIQIWTERTHLLFDVDCSQHLVQVHPSVCQELLHLQDGLQLVKLLNLKGNYQGKIN